MNVLVLGGTRYFGKRLVQLLLDRGHAVTLATRGTTPDSFGTRIDRKVIDRGDSRSLQAVASAKSWDVVVDQICYSPDEAAIACEVFEGRVGRYVHTSTASVYFTDGERIEVHFDPFHYPIRMGDRSDFNYGEGKRLAEAVFFQKAKFPVAAMRIPIVLGPDDYTGRLEFHIERVGNGRPVFVTNMDAETSFISSAEAAKFLLWLAEGSATGPLNACSHGRISIREILSLIESRLKTKARVSSTGLDENHTPFVDETSKWLNHRRASTLGFEFERLESWFPSLVNQLCDRFEGAGA